MAEISKKLFNFEQTLHYRQLAYEKNKEFIKKTTSIDWTDYFLAIANLIAQKSKDAQTKHGCVITDRHNHIIGTGYNSFSRSRHDEILPNLRPRKYEGFILHAEDNAISNIVISPWLIRKGCIAYVTGRPCLNCLNRLWNNNITTIYAQDRRGSKLEKDEEDEFNYFLIDSQIEYFTVKPNFEWCTTLYGGKQ